MYLNSKRIVNKLKLLIIIILSVIPGFNVLSQNDISISDTLVTRTEYFEIPVNGTLQVNAGDNVSIEIVYDSRIIDIKSAIGGNGMAITEAAPAIATDFTKLDSAKLTITSSNVVPVTNGIICKLSVKGLVFSDSVGYIHPYKIIINGIETPVSQKYARVLVRGTLIFPNYPDNLGDAVPNPFFYSTKLNFSLEKPSKVHFILYSLIGGLIAESQNSTEIFKIYNIIDNQRVDASSVLAAGVYYLIVTPVSFETSSGYYMLVMQTDRDIYNKNLIYNK